MAHIPQQHDDADVSMAELAASAHAAGILTTAHMNKSELIEAIRQQHESDAVLPSDPPQGERTPPESRRSAKRPTNGRARGVSGQAAARRPRGGVTA